MYVCGYEFTTCKGMNPIFKKKDGFTQIGTREQVVINNKHKIIQNMGKVRSDKHTIKKRTLS